MTKEAQYVQFVNRKLTRINGGPGMFVIIKYKLSAHCIHIRILHGQIFCHFKTEIFQENNKLFAQISPLAENEIDVTYRRYNTAKDSREGSFAEVS